MAEAGGTLAYQHYMAGMLHYGFGQRTHVLDVMHCAHRAGAAGGTVHAAGIKFNHTFLVGKAAQAHAVIIGIIFGAGDDCDSGIESVSALDQLFVTGVNVAKAVSSADDDVLAASGCRGGWLALSGRVICAPGDLACSQ